MSNLVGWVGATLVLVSYAQRQAVRLRQVNLIAGCLLLIYNISIAAWPAVTLELAVATINLHRLRQHRQETPQTADRLGDAPV